jgi:hypothetical protein
VATGQKNMVETNNSITNKIYKKLSIQINLNGLSFCIKNSLNNTIELYQEANFDAFNKDKSIEDNLKNYFLSLSNFKDNYDEVLILHDNPMNTFVPKSLFDENYLGTYLQYHSKVFDTDYFTYDQLNNSDMVNVYIPYVNFNNFFIEQFGSFEYKHLSTIFLNVIQEKHKNNHEKMMFVYMQKDNFQMIVLKEGKLFLHNHFSYKTKEDFIYYVLFTAEQLHLNPEDFKLKFIGDINIESEIYQIAFNYIRHVDLCDVSEGFNSSFSDTLNRKFNLLFST